MTATTEPLVRLRGIVRRFENVVANDGVDLTVSPGTVHAVVGENGAGKSTLMKILAGEERPDAGTIEVAGSRHDLRSPREAQRLGVGIVHQHFLLAGALRVWENVVLGDEPGRWRLDAATARRRVAELAHRHGFDVPVDAYVRDLGVGARQRVEILKVLYRRARVIILDEPTAVLVPSEAQALFSAMRAFTAEGAAVVFISHKLDEVLAFADEITVMRAGRVAGHTLPGDTTARDLAAMMVQVEMPHVEPRTAPPGQEVVLRTGALGVGRPGEVPLLHDVNLSVRSGEIVGVVGVEGNGQSELLLALLGRTPAHGTVELAGQDVSGLPTAERRARGLAYIPEDRHRDGLVLPMTLRDNSALGYHTRPPVRRGPWFDRRAATRAAAEIIARHDVRGAGPGTPAAALSGGNQQKFVVGRELRGQPRVLLAAHPTRGVDIGAQAAIWGELVAARDRGLATLLVSADLEELLALSDRLLVLHRGRLVAELDPHDLDPTTLGEHMTGARHTGAA
ncbi:ABC transporter ATP-binding protein [Kineosporia sp. J2-2]|uniref:ABC transporter ATP-binding protein n=1 Tax=Kineosporia corallincola TaxID=2835133 RepID=A0ABS5TE24_9ACTN|nr:ABC transporter ATP-binding protein [Kineosporia corallincola]MBT0768461.1 ABC transporter ATP-binding protein [Kineosporia corallincola]